ncbi:MAG: TlpA family protein disulfide reductase [Bacteroidota bacterium]|nr:TlpA family protein disulfide reductase [Bacteroidota bacterium]
MKYYKTISYLIWGLVSLTLFPSNAAAQVQPPQNFKTFPSLVKQGDMIKSVYKTAGTAPSVTGVIYLFKDFKWEGHDVPLTKTDTGYISTYAIPEGTSLICYRFWLGDSVDVGVRYPYAALVHDRAGKDIAPGGYTEWGILRSKGFDGYMMPLVSKTAEIEPKTLVGLWLPREIGNMVALRHLFFDMSRGIKSYYKNAKADAVIHVLGNQILKLPDVNEREMISVERTYRRIINQPVAADSVKALLLNRYPAGLFRRLSKADSIYYVRKPEDRVIKFRELMQEYPFAKFPVTDYMDPAISDPQFFYSAFNNVLTYLFAQKQLEELKNLITEAPYPLLNNAYSHFVDYPFRMVTPVITVNQQLDLSTLIINTILQRMQARDEQSGRGYFSLAEWPKIVLGESKYSIAYHANLLYKAAKYADALKFAGMVKSYLKYSSIDFNTLYARLLDHSHKNAEAEEYMEMSVRANKASPDLILLLKNYYIKKQGSDKGFKDYYSGLVPVEQTEALHERLKKSLIHVPAPAFILKNLKGEPVELSKQKGKIVVLDFWATWCFPCKNAMPGMQTLVQKYSPDDKIQFYFISTMEESANYKKMAADFIREKKYDFNVLFDEVDPKTGKMEIAFNSYAKPLHFHGIPQKVIIDQDGYIRWTADGFNGDLVGLTREVDYVISLIKQEK